MFRNNIFGTNVLYTILSRLERKRQVKPGSWMAACPAHHDETPSLAITEKPDGQVLIHCHAGCPTEAVLEALGLRMANLFPARGPGPEGTRRAARGDGCRGPWPTVDDAISGLKQWDELRGGKVTRYGYRDDFVVLRFDEPRGKTFRPLHKTGDNLWQLGDPPGLLPLYRVEALPPDGMVYVVEGEKDCDAAWRLDLPAVTSAHGAKSARKSDWSPLQSRDIVIIADADDAGREYADEVAALLYDLECHIRVIYELPGVPPGGSVSDYVEAHDSREDEELARCIREIADATSPWHPPDKTAVVGDDDAIPSQAEPADVAEWPKPVDAAAYYGLAGDIVHTIEPHSEADPVVLLIQILVCVGNVVGRGPHFYADGARHGLNLFTVLIGETAKSRKGTAWAQVFRLFKEIEKHWSAERVASGLSSGEGLIWAVRDPIYKVEHDKKTKKLNRILIDAGESDKRLLVHEPEFASVLRVAQRDGNTLSPLLRLAWERGKLRTLTKNSPAAATDAHVSVIGHIVADELRRYLDRSEIAGGFANRFVWLCVRRSKCLPEGGALKPADFTTLLDRLDKTIRFGKVERELKRDDKARAIWHAVYPTLSEGKPGLAGALIARGEAQVMRLAAIYALLDCSPDIRPAHLNAALALWEYAERSVYHVFGKATGDPMADEIWASLRASPDGLTRTQIRDLFQRNIRRDRLGRALALLHRSRLAQPKSVKTDGRPAEVWVALP